jgi:3-deoxy-D-manno-octulosonic-acid transferase
MLTFFYNIGIHLFTFAIWLSSLWNTKARKMRMGRRHWRREIQHKLPPKKAKRYWFHCASLGEFEMARPVIEQLQVEFPETEIVVSFFSPSGYEQRSHFLCTGVFYLPMDTPRNARKWYELVQPDVAVFVKYEFWLNFMKAGNAYGCDMTAISVLFREGQFFLEPWASAWKDELLKFRRIFVQNKASETVAKEEEFKNIIVAGDIRYDRVLDTVAHAETIAIAAEFKGNSPLLIGGSTWPEEEKHVFNYLSLKSWPLGWKWILAPHDIGPKHIAEIMDKFSDYYPVLFSKWEESQEKHKHKILVVDNIGYLSRLYRYADAAVIGGAYGKGLHNILEAAAFGMPILFGHKHQKFPEAEEAIDWGFACGARDYNEFELFLNRMLGNVEWRQEAAQKSRDFVKQHSGSTEIVMQYIRTIHNSNAPIN